MVHWEKRNYNIKIYFESQFIGWVLGMDDELKIRIALKKILLISHVTYEEIQTTLTETDVAIMFNL